MNQQKRFLLAMVLSGVVLAVWGNFFAPPPAENAKVTKKEKDGANASKKGGTQSGGTAAQSAPDAKPKTTTPGADPKVVAKKAKVIAPRADVLASKKFKVTLVNRGARVQKALLLDPAQYQKAGNLFGTLPEDSENLPFALTFGKNNLILPADAMFEVVEAESKKGDGGYSSLTYRYDDPAGRFRVDRTYALNAKSPYTIDMSVSVTNHTPAPVSDQPVIDIFGFHDPKKAEEKSFLDFRPDELETVCRTEDDTERGLYQALEKEVQTFDKHPVKWGAVGTRYFLWSLIPTTAAKSCEMKVVDKHYVRMRVTLPPIDIKAGQTHTFNTKVYLGPKDLDVFGIMDTAAGKKLELDESVDYGILSVLARPMRWTLNKIHELVHNWGLAIILLTLLIKLLTWRAMEKSYSNSERMKLLQPKLEEIRAKYENDQQRLTEETMALFKEHQFNPAGGCLPLLIQMPILYALYVMIMNSVELYQADFLFWYTDLSAPDPYFALPIAMGAIMVIQNKFMAPSAGNPQAEMMMKIMPVTFTAFMLFLPSGLVLYYFVNLLLGLLQQYLIRRKFAKKDEDNNSGGPLTPEVVPA